MRASRSELAVFLLATVAGMALAAAPAAAAQVDRFSPQGTVKQVRQATALFSEPMVAFGDPRAADPFEVTCSVPGAGRWIDGAQWVYDFERDVPAATRCRFRLRPGLMSLGGHAVTGRGDFEFSTGGPAIRSSLPREGSESIDEEQAFILLLDAEPTEASVLQHVGFAVDGIVQRVGARIVTGATRESILKDRFSQPPRGPVLVIQAAQRFPSRARVVLTWGRGVAAQSGVATDADQALTFKVRDPFAVNLECERENKRAGCVPITPIRVRFSAPVPMAEARRVTLYGPGGRAWAPQLEEDEADSTSALAFKGPFPEKAHLRLELPAGFRDDAGRTPVNAARFPLDVRMEAFPPLAKFAARFGILEANAVPALPVTVRNIEPSVLGKLVDVSTSPQDWRQWVEGRIYRLPPSRGADALPWLRKVAAAQREKSVFAEVDPARRPVRFAMPKPRGVDATEVIGIPLSGPGFYVVELASPRLGAALLGKRDPMYVPAAALVTNLGVHLKRGPAGALVWVTALDTAQPVAGARVSVHDCAGRPLWTGTTDRQGLAPTGALPSREAVPSCSKQFKFYEGLGELDGGLFVTAERGDDLAFVHSSWDQGIEPWRFRLPTSEDAEPIVAHTVLDRALFRAGETVSMKHVIRLPVARGLGPVPPAERPTEALVRHLGSDDKYERPLSWDARGVALDAWAIPAGAKLGTYEIALRGPAKAGAAVAPESVSARFQVQEFRVPLMKAVLRPPSEPLIAAPEFPLDLSVAYLSGGGASRLPVVLRVQVDPKRAAFDAFDEFTFANGALAEGIVRRGAEVEEVFYEEDDAAVTDAEPRSPARPAPHQQESLTLDAAGAARTTVSRLPSSDTPREVLAELEFRDPNGETQTASTRVPLWPAAALVGIRAEDWAASREVVRAQVGVVDVRGRAVAGSPVEVDVFERAFYSHRKRLVGGFYAYDHVETIRRIGPLCRGTTDAKGLFDCEGKAPASGRLVLQASTADGEGRRTFANQEIWVAGADDWWFDVHDSDRIDLLPEERRYEPGQTAKLQVRMPFREATALVTVERDRVLDARVVPLSGKAPIIEVPIAASYAPNVFVSALVVRGRVSGVEPTALVDLGRPAFKLGVAEVKVGWRAFELKVAVTPDRSVYRTRERARVHIAATTADGHAPPAGSEIAVAAVDEGLLELLPNPTWNLLEAMMRRRSYGVETATAQMHVLGKRHFGKKALPQGGGGGRQPTRELFETLLSWQARVPLDADGHADVDIPLNDSITAFRIVAVAMGGEALFGTGAASIRTTRDLMVLPGIAPLAREGDRMRSEVTVRNATERSMDVVVAGRVVGLEQRLEDRPLTLAAGEARSVGWDVTVPAGVESLRWEVEATERGEVADRVAVTQKVVPAVPVRVYQATLVPLERPLRQPVERPADALPGRGGVSVALGASLADGLDTLRQWMERYPYTCLEQQVSRAIALRDERRWQEIAGTLPGHLDQDGLLKYFPTAEQGSEVLTSYVLAIADAAGWKLPPDVEASAEAGLQKFVKGAIARRSSLPTADLTMRKLAAVAALARHGAADASLLDSIPLEPNLWPTSAVLDWWSVLRRIPGAPNREARLRLAEQIVRARLTADGTTMGFSTERSDDLWWLMVSADVNAVRLVLDLIDAGQWPDEVPRLVRGALGRQRRGAWRTTVANAWGALAVERFSRAFESTPVAGITTAALGGASKRLDWSQSPKGGTLSFAWPAGQQEMAVDHAGAGRPWVTVESRAAIPPTAPVASGFRVDKRVTAADPSRASTSATWKPGDLVRVHLDIEAEGDMTWVVVDDPIPAGASHLGSGLGGQSRLASRGEEPSNRVRPAFVERGFEGFRAYYAYVPKGRFAVEYTVRLNQSGTFQLPATRVEALYAPEMFGELPNPAFRIEP